MKLYPNTLDFREAHHLLADSIVPRPIALISTVDKNGVFNVAPYASITIVAVKPTLVGFSVATRRDGRKKDTIRNIEASGEFVVNIPTTENMAEAMNRSGFDFPPEVDEFKETGLTPAKADIVKAPMVSEAPINLECRVVQILEFGKLTLRVSNFVIAEVLVGHIKDEFYSEGHICAPELRAIGRFGSEPFPYCRTTDVFDMKLEFKL